LKTIGIVGEYNPFHNGHLHHMRESLAAVGDDAAVVCVMSGDFVQRGEAAVFSKFPRAEAAVRCGVSLVLELPLPWSLSSAEGFCRGAVGLLGAIGVVDLLSFGSEAGTLEPLNALAVALLDPALDQRIRTELETGCSYAAARQRVLETELGNELAGHLERPNNILAVEYLRALYEQRLSIEPLTIPRSGAGHDRTAGSGTLRSASELRGLLRAGQDITDLVPSAAEEIFRRELHMGRGPMPGPALETAILSRLRFPGVGIFDELPDAAEGLENLLRAAARTEPTLDAAALTAKSKRYALSRLRRMLLCAALGIKRGLADGIPPYARVLAADNRGRELLRRMSEHSTVPVVTKPAAVKELSPEARQIFELGATAHDLYVLGYTPVEERRGGGDWRATPAIISSSTRPSAGLIRWGRHPDTGALPS